MTDFYRKVVGTEVTDIRTAHGVPWSDTDTGEVTWFGQNSTDEEYAEQDFYPEVEVKPEITDDQKLVEESRAFTAGQAVIRYQAVDKTSEELTAEWEEMMRVSDGIMTRAWEDHIRDDHGGVANTPHQQEAYNQKAALRARSHDL